MSYSQAKTRQDLFGRRVLYATLSKTPDGSAAPLDEIAVAKILNQTFKLHLENLGDIDYLQQYYRGNQPHNEKSIRPEINNQITENRAFEIVEFKKGYEFSHPIQYTNASIKEIDSSSDETTPISALNTYARIEGKEAKDLSLAEWMYISGAGYRICLPKKGEVTVDDAPYFTDSLDPRQAFVVYSTDVGHEQVLGGTYAEQAIYDENGKSTKVWSVGVYTKEKYFQWSFEKEPDDSIDFFKVNPTVSPNTIGLIPIIEYPLNESRIGYVELCLSLFNAINAIDSNRVNAIEQFVQALLVFINCELEKDKDDNYITPESGDAVVVKGSQGLQADVKYLVEQLDQSDTQVTKEDLLNAAYEICGVPDRKNRSSTGGDTGQAVVLRDGWGAAEARAKSTEKLFKKSEYDYLKIVLKICRDTQVSSREIGGLTLKDVEIKFTRNRNDNMLLKAQTLEILLRSGVNPEDAFEWIEMFPDPNAVYEKSKPYLEAKAQEQKPATASGEGVPNGEISLNAGADKDINNTVLPVKQSKNSTVQEEK